MNVHHPLLQRKNKKHMQGFYTCMWMTFVISTAALQVRVDDEGWWMKWGLVKSDRAVAEQAIIRRVIGSHLLPGYSPLMGWTTSFGPHGTMGQEEPWQELQGCSRDTQEPEQVVHSLPSSLPHILSTRTRQWAFQTHWKKDFLRNFSSDSDNSGFSRVLATDSVVDSSRCRDSSSSGRSNSTSEDNTGTSKSPTVRGTRRCPGLQLPQRPTLRFRQKHAGMMSFTLTKYYYYY